MEESNEKNIGREGTTVGRDKRVKLGSIRGQSRVNLGFLEVVSVEYLVGKKSKIE